jgi:hypothetical protein
MLTRLQQLEGAPDSRLGRRSCPRIGARLDRHGARATDARRRLCGVLELLRIGPPRCRRGGPIRARTRLQPRGRPKQVVPPRKVPSSTTDTLVRHWDGDFQRPPRQQLLGHRVRRSQRRLVSRQVGRRSAGRRRRGTRSRFVRRRRGCRSARSSAARGSCCTTSGCTSIWCTTSQPPLIAPASLVSRSRSTGSSSQPGGADLQSGDETNAALAEHDRRTRRLHRLRVVREHQRDSSVVRVPFRASGS